MVGTILSVLIAIFLRFYGVAPEGDFTVMQIVMLIIAILFLFSVPLGSMFSWGPLQKAEQNATPRILDIYQKDFLLKLASWWLTAFPLITLALVLDAAYVHLLSKTWFLAIWVVLLGISIDALRFFGQRILGYLNPFTNISMFSKKALTSIQNEQELDLCHWIDGLSEMAVKGIQHNSTSLTNSALSEEQNIARQFLNASKSIAHRQNDPDTQKMGISDKVSYTLFYIYQRLDMLFGKALKNRLETTCSHIITTFGKIALDAAKYDLSLASAPLRFIGKCGLHAQDEGLDETALTASCALSEVGNAILNDIDVTYYEIKDPFLSIINGLEMLAKGAFRRDKSTNIAVLIQPLIDLKRLFETEKMKAHQDTPAILQNIDRVLGEFGALQLVMNTMPSMPKINTEDEIEPAKP